jgi:ubiquinone/menaquinone biosynthesis C-methylase UbiE
LQWELILFLQNLSIMAISTQGFNGSVPQHYDDLLGPFLFEPFAEDLAKRVSGYPTQNVLELAAGTGRLTTQLIKNLQPGASLTVTDLNEDMVLVAKSKNPSSLVAWDTVDMTAIPYVDNHFDLVVAQFGVMLVPDKLLALQNIFRVLKNDGKLVFSVWGNADDNPVWKITADFVNEYLEKEVWNLYNGPFSMQDESLVFNILKEAGFRKFSVENVRITGTIGSAALATKGFIHGLPVGALIEQDSPGKLPVVEELLEERMRNQLGDLPLASPLFALVFTAEK